MSTPQNSMSLPGPNVHFLKKVSVLLVVVLGCTGAGLAAERPDGQIPVRSEGTLTFYLDTASFRASQNQTLQEFYYQIALSQIAFQQSDRGYEDQIKTSVAIADSAGKLLIQDEWQHPVLARRLTEIAGRDFLNQFEMRLDPGSYRLTLTIQDLNSKKQGSAELPFQARGFDRPSLTMSDIQVSSTIRADTSGTRFMKNSLHVVPHPSRTFSSQLPLLYFYFEIYPVTPTTEDYEISYALLDAHETVVKSLPPKQVQISGDRIEAGAINVGTLSDSTYFLHIEVKNLSSGISLSTDKRFLNQPLPGRLASAVDHRIESMSKEELQTHLGYIQYLLRSEDKKMLREIDSAARKRFLIDFWRALDPRPYTPENEFWQEYFRRIEYANENFSSSFSSGWKTDQGRVLLKFGIPNDKESFPAQPNAKPYEVWYYYRDGGEKFIFAEIEGLGKYELIYSSDETELTRPDWKTIIGDQ